MTLVFSLVSLVVGFGAGFAACVSRARATARGRHQLLEEWKAFATHRARHGGSIDGSYALIHKDGRIYSAIAIRLGVFHPLVRILPYPPDITLAEDLKVDRHPYEYSPRKVG